MKLATRAVSLAGLLLGLVACDPVQSDAIAALGGEAQGVRPGPLHRPGQPCLLCHDGAPGDPGEFSVAGTVFQNPADPQAARGARVELKAADGSSSTQTTNAAGNFYIPARSWQPRYPLQVSVSFESFKVSMTSNIGRDGACASCHFDPAGTDSPGHVYAIPIDAGMPP
jgi:hypothetical protein